MITELAYNLSKDFSNMDTETSIAIYPFICIED